MNLPTPSPQYSQEDEARTRAQIGVEVDAKAAKDFIFGKIYMRDTVTGARVTVTVVSGVLTVT